MSDKAKLIGINHVAIEVGDVDEALALNGRLFDFELRGPGGRMAFLDMGDQFLAIGEGAGQPADSNRHFGLVVDDVDAVREALGRVGIDEIPTRFPTSLDFRDPWGNLFQVVDYREIQFERADGVKRVLGITDLEKSESARREIADKGLGEAGG